MQFHFPNPYTSTRLPLFARNIVSTSHPLAAQAGLRMLWKGGNAVDAAIAAAAAIYSQCLWAGIDPKPIQKAEFYIAGRANG